MWQTDSKEDLVVFREATASKPNGKLVKRGNLPRKTVSKGAPPRVIILIPTNWLYYPFRK